jgi:hypothetical protein
MVLPQVLVKDIVSIPTYYNKESIGHGVINLRVKQSMFKLLKTIIALSTIINNE